MQGLPEGHEQKEGGCAGNHELWQAAGTASGRLFGTRSAKSVGTAGAARSAQTHRAQTRKCTAAKSLALWPSSQEALLLPEGRARCPDGELGHVLAAGS